MWERGRAGPRRPAEAWMSEHGTNVRDVARLEVARLGKVEETGDRLMPFRLLDGQGVGGGRGHRVPAPHACRRRQPGVTALLLLRIAVVAPVYARRRGSLASRPEGWRPAILRCGSRRHLPTTTRPGLGGTPAGGVQCRDLSDSHLARLLSPARAFSWPIRLLPPKSTEWLSASLGRWQDGWLAAARR